MVHNTQQHNEFVKKRQFLKSFAITLVMVLFAQFAQAQQDPTEVLRMSNGRKDVPTNGFLFYDSGGTLLYDPQQDPINANEYNWTTWYQHNEEYTLTLVNPNGGGIKVVFTKLLVNNDPISFYEGDVASSANLICTFCNNDYSSEFCSTDNPLTIESEHNMTIHFKSDYHWRDEGWDAKVFRTSEFTIRPPMAVMAACDNMMSLIPTCKANDLVLQYRIGTTGAFTTYSLDQPVDMNEANFGTTGLVINTQSIISGTNTASTTSSYTFQKVAPPGPPTWDHNATANSVTAYFPDKNGANDTYYIRWKISNNPADEYSNPNLWPNDNGDHEFQQPSNTPISVPAGEIDYTNTSLTPPFYVFMATRGTTCPEVFSTVEKIEVEHLYVPEPTITFETNANNTGTTTISCSLADVVIYFTYDGSTPDPVHVGGPYPTFQYDGSHPIVPAGATVKAIATKPGFTNSTVASEIFIPGAENGQGQNGVYGNIVLLDDREDHSWSYYSDGDQPVHRLKPVDVKITYKGFGENTMTTTDTDDTPTTFDGDVDSTAVAVGPNVRGNQFIYLKTLENAEEDGSGDYPYTMIPNPFSKRPTYQPSAKGEGNDNGQPKGNRAGIETHCEDFESYSNVASNSLNPNGGGSLPTGWTYTWNYTNGTNYRPHLYNGTNYSVDGVGIVMTYYRSNGLGATTYPSTLYTTIELTAGRIVSFDARCQSTNGTLAYGYSNGTSWNQIGTATISTNQRTTTFTVPANANNQYLAFRWTRSSGNGYNSIVIDNICTETMVAGVPEAPILSPAGGSYTSTQSVTISDVYAIDNSTFYYTTDGSTPTTSSTLYTGPITVNHTMTIKAIAINSYGTSGITEATYNILNFDNFRGFYAWRVKSLSTDLTIKRANGTYVGVGGIIDAEEEIQFVTTSPYNNEVEFEALWAQAYVVTTNTATGLHAGVSYERNFVVGAAPSNTGLNVPVTYSRYYPDGTGGTNTINVGTFTCAADTKFEYMNLNNGTLTANNHYLCMGRGMNGTAALLQGINQYVSGNTNYSNLNYTLRIESGTYTQLAFVRAGTATVSDRYLIKAIMGSDYDRANKKDNTNLSVSPQNSLFFSTQVVFNNDNNKSAKTFDLVVKSGKYQQNYWDNQQDQPNSSNDNDGGGWTTSFYCGQNQSGSTYPGARHVVIEGGELASLCGGRGVGSTSPGYCDPTFETFNLRIKGGLFHGCIYGGAADNPTFGSRRIAITGGEIRSWVAGGANGTGTASGTGDVDGNTYVYVGGKSIIGGEHAQCVNTTNGGQVYGAGRGLSGRTTSVNNSYVVIADLTQIFNNNNLTGTTPNDHDDITGGNGGNVYGGGNYGYITTTSNVYILGGTIQNHVFGGAFGNGTAIPTSNVYVKGGKVNGSVYGGSNSSGTVQNSNVFVSGGQTTNVFGGGYGSSTVITKGTKVTVSDGIINNNVYGGGEEGTVGTTTTPATTNVSVSGGTMKNVYGAGKGNASTSQTANINGTTTVSVSGGTIDNVYGGGEAGNVINGTNLASTVTIKSGTIGEDVFGGGRLGKTTGNVVVNVFGGDVSGNVYGGAYGKRGTTNASNVYVPSVYISGTHTVNITGGNIYTNVYGGSRNADDALTESPSGGETAAVNRVNISGGHVYYQVFAGGYFGHTYGSVYAFVGQNAISNAPNAEATTGVGYSSSSLIIDGSVWAGADFGNFDGYTFGAATIEGYSNIYIDGKDYNTTSSQPSDAGYMIIGSSVIGTGTSCYAGDKGSHLIIRNYGRPIANPNYSKEAIVEPYTTATRNLMSLQFFNTIVLDDTHLQLIGQGRINSLVTTEKYSVYAVHDILRMVNGSSVFIDQPMDQMKRLGSYVCANQTNGLPGVYADTPSYTEVGYGDLATTGHDNKFRVNGGSYLNVKYVGAYGTINGLSGDYGELIGYFYMMTEDENHTCAYARPKQSKDEGNTIDPDYDNPHDGGFLSYHDNKNTYTAGQLNGNSWVAAPGTGTPGVQMPYENHTLNAKNGEQYFRIWRYGGIYSYRQGVLSAVAKTVDGYSTTDVVISLPAQHGIGSYFKFKLYEGFPMIDYGDDVMTVNAGVYELDNNGDPATDGWMYYDNTSTSHAFVEGQTQTEVSSALTPLNENPNVNFGLVAIPQGALSGGENQNWLICSESGDDGEILASEKWYNNDNVTNPSILFRLTYNNKLTNNATWDPIIITLEQYDINNDKTDEIQIALAVSTVTTINQDFGGQVYAMMNKTGTQAATYTAKVVLPGFIPFVNVEGDLSNWTFESAVWHEADDAFDEAWQEGSDYINPDPTSSDPAYNDKFSMQIVPSVNFDNTLGWNSYDHTAKDLKWLQTGTDVTLEDKHLAYTDGRNPTAFDFILHYDGRATCQANNEKMGELEVTLHFTNINNGSTNHEQSLKITIEVYRRGEASIYFLDGVNGNNAYTGTYPNAAKKTLSGIFNRTNYIPGDNIFVVNTVTANGATALDWNGEQFGQVTLYRYPGGHELLKPVDEQHPLLSTEAFLNYNNWNPGNLGFTGSLVKVERNMNMHGIVLDGAYDITHPTAPNTIDNKLVPDPDTYQAPIAPLIEIAENGKLTVYANSKLQWNYTSSNGGAVYDAGTLVLRSGSDINHNQVSNTSEVFGAGVYVAKGAYLFVSDSITIDTNYRVLNNVTKNSNVYLVDENSVIQVGTSNPNDGIDPLQYLPNTPKRKSAKIGVSKAKWPDYSYNPIAYSDGHYPYLSNIIPANPNIAKPIDYAIYDDDLYYKLVTLNNTPGYEPSYDYLFWVGTWVTYVREEPSGFNASNIDTPEELAWAISIVNGLNGENPLPNTSFTITADIDMSARIWVPIGIDAAGRRYGGTFNANGHVINGIKSSLNEENMGMFGAIGGSKCNIENMILNVSFTGGNSVRMGSLAAVMVGGCTIKNVETAGVLTGTSSTTTMGGLVAENRLDSETPIIHSSFAVNTMTASNPETNMGGLVGSNIGKLYNSYANTTMSGSDRIGGLVGVNAAGGTVENCYAVLGKQTYPAFAYQNEGTLLFCYTDVSSNYYVEPTVSTKNPEGHGYFSEVKDRKEIGYMYDDNAIEIDASTTNDYVPEKIEYYKDGDMYTNIWRWNGLLSVLNQWVEEKNAETSNTSPYYNKNFTPWFRSISSYTTPDGVKGYINGDLPVLAFPMNNSMATLDNDGKYLQYGSIASSANGIDKLLTDYAGKEASIFLYGNALDVTKVPTENLKVFINEDACLKQSGTDPFINTTVGITFDNSFGQGTTQTIINGNNPSGGTNTYNLSYDWHMMSTPLRDAKMGTSYSHVEGSTYTPDKCTETTTVYFQKSPADITVLNNSYFPNGLLEQTDVTWDFYSFFEPEYHWINLKRNKMNHFHRESVEGEIQDKPYQMDYDWDGDFRHYQIDYTGTDQAESKAASGDDGCIFTPGKGYMMAISQDSYMSSTGTLNNGNFTIDVTRKSAQQDELGFNLLGNPYQAYLNMSAFLDSTDSPNSDLLDNSYWVYIAETDNYIANSTTASTNWELPSSTLHPHQAFFVRAKAEGEVNFNYGMATAKPDDGYDSGFRGAKIDYPLVNLIATNERGQKDLVVIEANRPEIGGAPKLRAMNNTGFELYARTGGNDYSILFTEEGTDRVAVGFKTLEGGAYTLNWNTQNGKFKYLQLVDNITGCQRDMLTNNSYTFEAQPSDMKTRFYVIFKTADDNEEMDDHFAFFNGSDWVIDGKGTLQLVDMTGRVLYSKNLSGETTTRAHFDNFASGVYMLQLINRNGELKTQKIVIQ